MADAPTVEEARKGGASQPLDFAHDKAWIAESAKFLITDDLRRALKEEGISQSELGRRTGQKRQDISRIINERRNLQIETMAGFAAALDWQLIVRLIRRDEVAPVMPISKLANVREIVEGAVANSGSSDPHRFLVAMVPPFQNQVEFNSKSAGADFEPFELPVGSTLAQSDKMTLSL